MPHGYTKANSQFNLQDFNKVQVLLQALILSIVASTDGSDDSKIFSTNTNITHVPYVGSYHVFREKEAWISSAYQEGNSERVCSGIIIDSFTAITAGRCIIVDEFNEKFRVMDLNRYHPYFIMGVADYTATGQATFQRRDLSEVHIHPKAAYAKNWPVKDSFDIGAIKWRGPLQFNDHIQKAPLLPFLHKGIRRRVFESIVEAKHCWIPGWGEGQPDENEHEIGNSLTFAHILPLEDSFQWCLTLISHSLTDHCLMNDAWEVFPFRTHIHHGVYTLVPIDACCTMFYDTEAPRKQCKRRLAAGGYYCHMPETGETSVAWGDAGSPIICLYKGNHYVVGIHTTGETKYRYFSNGPLTHYMVPGFWLIDEYMHPFVQSISHLAPVAMSQSQRNEPEIGIIPIILLATASSPLTS